MLKIPILSVATIFIFSCGQKSDKSIPPASADSAAVDSIAIINDPKNNLNIQTNSFSEIDSSGIIMFPLSMGESSRDSERSSYYKEIPNSSYWNIIFYNSKTSAYYLLSDRKMLISNFHIKYSTDDYMDISYTRKHILYKITTDDHNKDKKLTPEDPEYLFVSDKEGKNFRQISPVNYHLRSWLVIKSTNKILMAVTKDSDNNKKFEDKDEVTTFQIDIDKDSKPTEIFSSEFKNNLKILFDKDWKRIKQ